MRSLSCVLVGLAVAVSACGGGDDGDEQPATREGLEEAARDWAETLISDPVDTYDTFSAECQDQVTRSEFAAQMMLATQFFESFLGFGFDELQIGDVTVEVESGESGASGSATIELLGPEGEPTDDPEPMSWRHEDGRWVVDDCEDFVEGGGDLDGDSGPDDSDVDLATFSVESGFTSEDVDGTRSTTVGAVVTNGNSSTACNVQVQFNLLDATGAPFDTETETIDFIPAGASVPVSPFQIGYDDDEPAELSVEVIAVDGLDDEAPFCDDAFSFSRGIELVVDDATIESDDFWTQVVGRVSNPGDELIENASLVCVLRDGNGEIVGGEATSIWDPLPPGGTVAFDFGLTLHPDVTATLECRAFG